ncbi:MAG TPA: SDR family NAD(P)-dependent oxidoreductase, partial [Beijerinckiaceae bacterium]
MSALFDLTGRTAFVTGAASGLGRAMAEGFAEHGAHVVMADLDEAGLAREAEALTLRNLSVDTMIVDVRDRARVHESIAEAARRLGRLDIVVANAGVTGGPAPSSPEGAIENVAPALWDNTLAINQTGVFSTLQAAAAVMKPQGSGRILVTSSISGLKTSGISGYPYSAAKAAVAHLVRVAAVELAPYGVLVNGIAPGVFRTNISGGRLKTDPERARFLAESSPLKRIADPSEI